MGRASSRKKQRRYANVNVWPSADCVSYRFNEDGLPPATTDDRAADLKAIAIDREIFAANPGLKVFRRFPVFGEFRYVTPVGSTLDFVEVTQIRPGMRTRFPVFRPLLNLEIN